MAVQDYFDSLIAYNPDNEELVAGAAFQVYAVDDASYSTPLPLTDPVSGAAITTLQSSNIGVLPDFRVSGEPQQVILKSGAFVTKLTSRLGVFKDAGFDPDEIALAIAAAPAAEAARDAALAAQAAAEAVGTTNDTVMTTVAADEDSAFAGHLRGTIAAEVPEAGADYFARRALSGSPVIAAMAADAVLSSPPAITASAGAPAGMTQVRQFSNYGFDAWAGFRVSGGPVSTSRLPIGVTSGGVGVAPGQPMVIEFDFEGDAFAFVTQAKTTSAFHLWCNEQRYAASHTLLSAVSGVSGTGSHYFKVDFGSRVRRRIRLEIVALPSSPNSFNGLYFAPTSLVQPPSEASLRLFVVGDSYGYGIGSTPDQPAAATVDTTQSWVYQLAKELGIADAWTFACIPSTGFVASHPVNSAGPYSGRRADVLPYLRPGDVLVLQGSINDGAAGIVGGLSAAVEAEVAYYRANTDRVLIVVTSPLYIKNRDANHTNAYNATKSGATAADVPFLDAFDTTMKLFYGTGSVGATTGDGNADIYGANESPNPSQHPSKAGHKAIARVLAPQLARAMRA